ncbi:Sin3 binding region of histone deacetylase complex subunit SAP30-domain-containing protein [Hyaloraphidium curvatum]|nr:Sin3 binding region of histone deacetylase complex subunit SAP30-domain-containing protein [Hyaloraphidium curvatum]
MQKVAKKPGPGKKPGYELGPGELPKVDFVSMDLQTLWRYKRAFKLKVKPNTPQEELADIVQKHYESLEINEKDAIVFFVYSVRNQGNVLKLPPGDILNREPREAPREG